MGASKRRSPSPPHKQDQSRKIGSSIGSGENCRPNSDFTLHPERNSTIRTSPHNEEKRFRYRADAGGVVEISRWCKPPVTDTKIPRALKGRRHGATRLSTARLG